MVIDRYRKSLFGKMAADAFSLLKKPTTDASNAPSGPTGMSIGCRASFRPRLPPLRELLDYGNQGSKRSTNIVGDYD